MKVEQLYWAAGFIDGEGSFGRHGGTIGIQVVQVDKWHIDKLIDIFGGNLNIFSRKEVKGSIYHRWAVYGPRAVVIMRQLHPLLSPRRQSRIEGLIDGWEFRRRKENHKRQYFPCTHKKEETTFVNSKGYKECRKCKTEANRRYRERIKSSNN